MQFHGKQFLGFSTRWVLAGGMAVLLTGCLGSEAEFDRSPPSRGGKADETFERLQGVLEDIYRGEVALLGEQCINYVRVSDTDTGFPFGLYGVLEADCESANSLEDRRGTRVVAEADYLFVVWDEPVLESLHDIEHAASPEKAMYFELEGPALTETPPTADEWIDLSHQFMAGWDKAEPPYFGTWELATYSVEQVVSMESQRLMAMCGTSEQLLVVEEMSRESWVDQEGKAAVAAVAQVDGESTLLGQLHDFLVAAAVDADRLVRVRAPEQSCELDGAWVTHWLAEGPYGPISVSVGTVWQN